MAHAVDHAPPSEVVFEVAGRDAVEAAHPALEAADVGVDVLDVIAAVRVFAFAGDELDVEEPAGVGELAVGGATIADEQRILGNDRLQHACYCGALQIGEHRIRRRAVTIAHDEHRSAADEPEAPRPLAGLRQGAGRRRQSQKAAKRARIEFLGVFCGNTPSDVTQFETWLGRKVDGILGYTGDKDWSDYDGSVGMG